MLREKIFPKGVYTTYFTKSQLLRILNIDILLINLDHFTKKFIGTSDIKDLSRLIIYYCGNNYLFT